MSKAVYNKYKTSIIVLALVLVPIFVIGCAFAAALACSEFWSSDRPAGCTSWVRSHVRRRRRRPDPSPAPSPVSTGSSQVSSVYHDPVQSTETV
ncbi:uncharacterized protein LDX57_011821 [Aspergillus melleus]|uniref:uncharacterized protein n=1 Tax=Aspergillus melleus TaxID=138277 RepID=UPI001E8D42DE|nr:uncharacterized protein LDX57_011821 [Aspergillus melleus]KAH8434183.1 hypothetical protein LDX57_011821 [Aspergillus melleus]